MAHATGNFALQMLVGAAVGVAGVHALLWFMRRVPLPSEGLYPLRTLAAALVIFGAATVAHGSGFLAVFVAGIALGDERAPTRGRSNGSTAPWPVWARSSPSPSSVSPSISGCWPVPTCGFPAWSTPSLSPW